MLSGDGGDLTFRDEGRMTEAWRDCAASGLHGDVPPAETHGTFRRSHVQIDAVAHMSRVPEPLLRGVR